MDFKIKRPNFLNLFIAVIAIGTLVSTEYANAGFFEWCGRLLATKTQLTDGIPRFFPKYDQDLSINLLAKSGVGFMPDEGTATGIFESEVLSKGLITARGGTLDGNSVWITALDRSYQCKFSFSIYSPSKSLGNESFTIPTLISDGIEIEGASSGTGLEATVLNHALEYYPMIKEVRIKLRAQHIKFDWRNANAHAFAVELANRPDRSEVIQDSPEYKALNQMGFILDTERTGLWHYSSGDVDHYFLFMTRP